MAAGAAGAQHDARSRRALSGGRQQSGRQPVPRHGALTPAGNQYRFTWWIARQVFTGVGQFAGRMMVVNWGAKSPVIYSVARNDELYGEWADGSATDKLALVARAAERRVPSPEGPTTSPAESQRQPLLRPRRHHAARRSLPLRLAGRLDELSWCRLARRQRHGRGLGRSTPVVYAAWRNGMLNGLWDGGRGRGTLTPAR